MNNKTNMSKKEEKVEVEKFDSKEKARRQAVVDGLLSQNPVKFLPRKAELDAWVKEAK